MGGIMTLKTTDEIVSEEVNKILYSELFINQDIWFVAVYERIWNKLNLKVESNLTELVLACLIDIEMSFRKKEGSPLIFKRFPDARYIREHIKNELEITQ